MTRQNREGALRQVGLREHFAEDDRADWGIACGLEYEWAPDRQGGCHLMSVQVQREIEGRDEAARADGEPTPDRLVPLRPRRDVQREVFAQDADRLLGGQAKRVNRSGDLPARVLDGLAGLDRQYLRELLVALA